MRQLISRLASESKIGKVFSACLDNGLQIYIKEKKDAPVVSLQLWIRTGSIHEGKYLGCGVSHFLEHILFQGTESYPGNSAADTIHRLGGDINAYTSCSCTVYHAEVPSGALETAADILADMVSRPLFPAAKFAREKEVILRERDMVLDNPDKVICEKLLLSMFQVHPVRHPIIGYKDKIESLTKDALPDYHSLRYSPARSFVTLCGAVDAGKAAAIISKKMKNWRAGNLDEPAIPAEPDQMCKRELTDYFKDPLGRVLFGYRTPGAAHPDVPALDLLSSILGESRSSRLVRTLKRERRLAVGIGSFNYTPCHNGIFGVNILCQPENTAAAAAGTEEEIERVRAGGVSPAELERELNQHVADYLRSLRSHSSLSRIIGNCVLTCGSPEYTDRYIELIAGMTPEKLASAAKEHLRPESASVIKLLPDSPAAKTKTKKTNGKAPEKIKMAALNEGQRIVLRADKSLPLIDVCVIFQGGVFHETAANAGLSRLLSSLLTAGAGGMDEEETAGLLDSNAIEFSAGSGNNTVYARFNCVREKLGTAMDILTKIISAPEFPEGAFEREKSNTLETIKSRALNPSNAAEDKLCGLLYGGHPYSLPPPGLPDSVASLRPDGLRKFFSEICLQPGKTVFGAAGDIDHEEIKDRIAKLCAAVKWNNMPWSGEPPRPVFPSAPVLGRVSIPRRQAFVMSAVPICDNHSDDSFALDFLSKSENSQASKLFKLVREKEALAYMTGMCSSRTAHEGYMGFYAGTKPEAASEVLELFARESRRLTADGLDKDEMEAARAGLLFDHDEESQNPGSIIFHSALSEFYGNGFTRFWRARGIYEKTRLKDVNSVIAKYLGSKAVVSVIAGPENAR
jgi:zinc protease